MSHKSPALASGFFTTSATQEAQMIGYWLKIQTPGYHSNSLNEHSGEQGLGICISKWS